MFPHVPQDPRWRNFSRMRRCRRVSSGKRSRGRFFRGTERLFFIKRHAISSWKYTVDSKSFRIGKFYVKFHEILFLIFFFFFSLEESIEYFANRIFLSYNLFLTQNFTLELIIDYFESGKKKKKKKKWRNVKKRQSIRYEKRELRN